MVDPLQAISRSQKAAVGLVGDAFDGVVRASRSGLSEPQEALNRIVALIAAIGDLAASTSRPLEALLTSQRNLANAMASFAQLQADMAEVLGQVAASHAAVVDALELLASPALTVTDLIRSEPAVQKARTKAGAKTPAKKAPAKKAPAKKRPTSGTR
ncbi:MAG TPA: hypothetical protein VF426_09680 [Marmoricola sp.]